ncbi:MAG: hypothetical protein R2911_25015 [Caldilineaceae bacterium]
METSNTATIPPPPHPYAATASGLRLGCVGTGAASAENNQPLECDPRPRSGRDFVYFNHAVHVKQGVGCKRHGRVDQMPVVAKMETLQMDWCLDCHRAPAKYIRPRRGFHHGLPTHHRSIHPGAGN